MEGRTKVLLKNLIVIGAVAICCFQPSFVQASEPTELSTQKIKELSYEMQPQMKQWRRSIHEHPELSWKEVDTSKKVADLLRGMGYENIKVGFNGTESGVMAELDTGKPGKIVAIRADMDALPIQEQNNVSYRSQVPGVAHACGHDAHTAALLGAAEVLQKIKGQLPGGKVRLLFQPAEENITGAKALIAEGALTDVSSIIGAHTAGESPAGTVYFSSGPIMSSADKVKIKIVGKGGHGGNPQFAVDPILAASTVVTTLQSIVSREVSPQDGVVVTVGKFNAGTADNIIPDTAELELSIRTLSPAIQKTMPARLTRLVDGIAQAMRCTAEITYEAGVSAVNNDEQQTKLARAVAEEILGPEKVKECMPKTASEDFSFYQQKVPGVFFFFGAGNKAKGISAPNHNPKFDVDDDTLWVDTAILVGYTVKAMEN